jgi:hypothetical protein
VAAEELRHSDNLAAQAQRVADRGAQSGRHRGGRPGRVVKTAQLPISDRLPGGPDASR